MKRDPHASMVVDAESLGVGDVALPFRRRTHAVGVMFVSPDFPRGMRLVLVGEGGRTERRIVKRHAKYRIATRLPAPGGLSLYRRAVGRRLVAWFPTFTGG